MSEATDRKGAGLGAGHVVPAVLLVFALADLATRAVPLERLAFRTWEPARELASGRSPFRPDSRFEVERACGDLWVMARRPDLRAFRHEVLTTDALGFRRAPGGATGVPDWILFGDSFAGGAGLSDEDTLAVQVERATGLRVFNAGGMSGGPADVTTLAWKLGAPHARIVFQFVERLPVPTKPFNAIPAPEPFLPGLPFAARSFVATSRLEILARRALRRVEDDTLLPDPQRGTIVSGRLPSGTELLFLADEVPDKSVEPSLEFWVWFRRALAHEGHELSVVLVPNKLTVYRALLRDSPGGSAKRSRYLDAQEAELRSLGIPVVQLTAPLQEEAARALAEGELVYWPDDTHWNPRGVRVAAREVARVLGPR